jgi:hypothetical protein
MIPEIPPQWIDYFWTGLFAALGLFVGIFVGLCIAETIQKWEQRERQCRPGS